jgi:hypothetical protein
MRPITDDDFDERGILKDRRSFRVTMTMADSGNRCPARLRDGGGNAVGRRPGFVVDAAVRRDLSFYDQYDAEVGEAWKNNPPTGAGEREFAGGRFGDACTVKSGGGRFGAEGSRGTLQLVEGELVCVADSNRSDAMIRDTREAAYQAYDADLQNAWRNQ